MVNHVRPEVWIRVDAGGEVGAGHLARCRVLADALIDGGARIRWACRQHALIERFIPESVDCSIPGEPSFAPLDLAEASELCKTAGRQAWIVIDHYGAGSAYIQTIRSSGCRVAIIDDHQFRSGADLRIAPTGGAADTLGTGLTGQELIGLEYALVHSAFSKQRHQRGKMERRGLIICFGGGDPQGLTIQLLRQMQSIPDMPIMVVLDDSAAVDQDVDHCLETMGGRRCAWLSPEELAKCLAEAELAIVSASGIAFETAVVGTPMIAVEWIDNQARHAACLRAAGIDVVASAEAAADALVRERPMVSQLGGNALIDGLGARRVAQAMGFGRDTMVAGSA